MKESGRLEHRKSTGAHIISSLKEKGIVLKIYESFGSTQSICNISGQDNAVHDETTGGKSVVLP